MNSTKLGMSALALLLLLICAGQGAAAAPGDAGEWLDSYDEAMRRARRENKFVLVEFTGSDWCHWCKVLDSEVFQTRAFKRWAAENVILLEVDFPRSRPLPQRVKQQNEILKRKYRISGFPTVLFLDAEGQPVGQTGYSEGGARQWMAEADAILSTAPQPAPRVAVQRRPVPDGMATALATGPRGFQEMPRFERTVDAAPTRLCESYVQAEARAYSRRIPMLVVAHPQEATAAYQEALKVMTHQAVALASENKLAVVNLTTPLTKGSDRVLWALFSRKNGNPQVACVLFDADGNTLIFENQDTLNAETFLRKMKMHMPAGTFAVQAKPVQPAPRVEVRPAPREIIQVPVQQPLVAVAPNRLNTRRVAPREPAYNGRWIEDFREAKRLARMLNRPMLVDFTGSDWCGWCIRLDDEVFSTSTFRDYAKKKFILVKLDYPRMRKLPAALTQQNKMLAKQYGIRSYPTVLLMDADGNPFQKMGYSSGGPGAFIQMLEAAISMR